MVALKTTSDPHQQLLQHLKRYLEINYVPEPAFQSMPSIRSMDYDKKQTSSYYQENSIQREIKREIVPELSFGEYLFSVIDKKQLNDVEVYKKVDLDRKVFSKIRIDKMYHPSRETVFKLMLSLQLVLTEAVEMMEFAGYSFDRSSQFDLIVKYCIENKIYDLMSVNELLLELTDRTL